ncbi:MEDS domain-containing protein [Salinigranum sp.]|uniref:MEDS domain-containing protein n=1 Tax=Salinigranum sp. TaxID=1966351 RepID=UPI003565FD5D
MPHPHSTDPRPVSTPKSSGRRHASTSHRGDHAPGPENHLALIYETTAEHLSTVVPYVRHGLEGNERVVYIADEHSPDYLRSVFRAAGIDVDADALTIHDAAEMYTPSGTFETGEMVDSLEDLVETVTDGPYDHLRLTGEMTWALRAGGDTLDRLVEYESQVNEFYTDHQPITGLCQYDRTKFDDDLLHDVVRSHPQQVYDATVTQNFAYLDPDAFSAVHPATSATTEFVEAHLDRVRAHSRRQQYQTALSELSTTSYRFLAADTDDVLAEAVTTIRSVLSPSLVGVYSYDEASEALEPASVWTAHGDADPTSLPDAHRDLLRDAFVGGEQVVRPESARQSEMSALTCGFAYPLERYGVLFVGWTLPHALDEAEKEFVRTVAHAVDAAFERAEYDDMLDHRDDQIRHLDRVNRTIREVALGLVHASSREEIHRTVCDRLADVDGYQFVWVGDRDSFTRRLTPRQWAGDGGVYLDSLYTSETGGEAGVDAGTGADAEAAVPTPTRRAAETGDAQFVPNSLTTNAYRAWRRVALDNGLYAAFCVPLVYDAASYGVLTVYADRPNALTEMERDVLRELGRTVGYAIDCVETQAGLHADNLTEVGLHLPTSESKLGRLATQVDGRVDVETVIPEAEGRLRLFFTVDDVAADRVLTAAECSTSVASIRRVTDRERGALFEAVLCVSESVPELLGAANGSVTRLVATPTGVDLTVEVPRRTDLRELVDRARRAYPGLSVDSIRRSARPVQSRGSFLTRLDERLTDRQFEALRLAYYGGYFEWPRDSSASDVASSMGVSQPTFSNHLRGAERKLLELLFDD